MQYSEEVLDRRTGELVSVSRGEWVTISELAGMYQVGPRKVRSVLRAMEFLGIEGSDHHARHRIQPWAIERGYGRRNRARAGARIPFDVVSPEGREWINARWSNALEGVEASSSGSRIEAARDALTAFQENRGRTDMPVHVAVSWLTAHFPTLTHAEVGNILEVSQQLVSRYVAERARERSERLKRRNTELPDLGKIRVRGLSTDQGGDDNECRR